LQRVILQAARMLLLNATPMIDHAHTNRLIHAASPYLQQHAHNPIDWYPWGEGAIARARAEDKPIFVSIGYSTCYWCHVMEREVFCNPEIGTLMNQCFINIKVDREERPDIDELYMAARQALTRQGGWPNNLLLTPDLKPFWAEGTMAADNRYGHSFPELVLSLAECWMTKRAEIEKAAAELTHYMQLQLSAKQAPGDAKQDNADLSNALYKQLMEYADPLHGGFFNAPKFPHETYLLFLLDYYRSTETPQALASVVHTLDAIAAGGIHDHLGGGFHRYAVDTNWHVPHFEKMLYNQALLGRCYVQGFALTSNPYYRYVAEQAYGCVEEVFTGPEGQFYSALDAETDAVEGAYYVWSTDAIRITLFKDQLAQFFSCYELVDVPEFAGHKHPDGGVIICSDPRAVQQLPHTLLASLQRLKHQRDSRHRPMLDTKVIAAWHGMMLGSYADAGRVLGTKAYLDRAEKAALFVERHLMTKEGRLLRIAAASIYGFLEDYAHVIDGLLALHEATGKPAPLALAIQLTERCCQLFEDGEHGGFFANEASADSLLRIKTADDNAMPSANSVMMHNLVTLACMTGNVLWQSKAERLFAAFRNEAARSPVAYSALIHAHHSMVSGARGGAQLPVRAALRHYPAQVKSGERFLVGIGLSIERHWHITKETLTVNFRPEGVTLHALRLPEVAAEYYEGEIEIVAELSLSGAEGEQGIAAELSWSPCDNRSCYGREQAVLEWVVKME
jgi:uncharacterized protein YyaL (SSP411 family)